MASPEDYELVDQSGYFDRDYYLTRNPDVRAAGVDPVEHYLNHGGMERRDPHPKFDTALYLEQCARFGEAPQNPLLHYLRFGAARGVNPIRKDPAWMHFSDAISSGSAVGPRPSLMRGVDETQSATRDEQRAVILSSGLFDRHFYNTTYRIVFPSDVDAVEDYLSRPPSEGRRPNLYFDPIFYLEQNVDVRDSGMEPFHHYLVQGWKQWRPISLLFNCAWYRNHYHLADDEDALAHYLRRRTSYTVSPLPEFDVEYYARVNPDVRASGADAFEHFHHRGWKELRNPSEQFDVKYYARRYLDGNLDQNPFIHFLQHKHEPGVSGIAPADEASIPRAVKTFTKPGPYFEELKPLAPDVHRRAKILAYYLPQFHSFPENDRWWGTGFTEWTNIARGTPRFEGHYQPRIPRDLGFYSLDTNATIRRQIEFAKAAGLFGFIYYYYWFDGKRLMEKPLNNFLADDQLDFPFCLMWANENWTRRWDGKDNEILISQGYRAEDDRLLVADFMRHIRDKRYIRLKGRPLLMIYRADVIPNIARTLERWRKIFRDDFGEDPILVMGQSFGATNPRDYGFDAAIEFPPHKHTERTPDIQSTLQWFDWDFSARVYRYEDILRVSLDEPPPEFPLIKTVLPGWDNDARVQGQGLVIADSLPEKYEDWLSQLVKRAQDNPFFGEPIVCVNAWNEWCEAAYLEPDQYFGSAYLNATARAVAGIPNPVHALPLLLVGHDAFPSGSQHLLLNIGRILKRKFGIAVEFLLLAGGAFEDAYRDIAPVTIASSDEELASFLADASGRGFRQAIANTAATGRVFSFFARAGIEAISLIHELSGVLRANYFLDRARAALQSARAVVFAAASVRDEVAAAVGVPVDDRMHLVPQGCYKEMSYSPALREQIRATLAVKAGEALVVSIGHAELRKGFDLFLQLWRKLNRNAKSRVHFCWVGGIHPQFATWIATELREATASGTFHMVGLRDDVDAFLSAADVFALTSREDPFPTVVHEALSIGLPVVAFDKAGGMSAFLKNTDMGVVVPHCDVTAMADAIAECIGGKITDADRVKRHQFVNDNLNFADYVEKLLHLVFPHLAKVSVAIPNYNYARLLPERLTTIFGQTYPAHEIIVLDDGSTDDSVAVLNGIADSCSRDIQVLVNKKNSGSVFGQWEKAAKAATGDFIWIAEADDLSEPTFLAEIMALMRGDPKIGFAFSDSCALHPDGSVMWRSYKTYYGETESGALSKTEVFDGDEFARRYLSVRNLILNASAVVWRREVLLQALSSCSPADFRLAGDWRLYLQALSVPGVRIGYISSTLNKHRRHDESVTHTLDAEKHVAEIVRCHAFAADAFQLPQSYRDLQRAYATMVREQLTRKPSQ
jgi:glycosyltransferase involved in cell wall biosynthesis